MNTSDGAVNQMFNSTLKKDAMTVDKNTTAGGTSKTLKSSENKLWLYSAWELWGSLPNDSSRFNGDLDAYKSEGTQYQYYKDRGITCSANCSIINDVARSGEGGNKGINSRSPMIYESRHFIYGNNGGGIGYSTDATLWGPNHPRGTQVCFAFGGERKIKFDTKDRGVSVQKQTLKVGAKITDPTSTVGSVDGLTLEGWYTDAKCSANKKWNFATDTISYDTTLYANWVPNSTTENAYWLAPAMKTTTANTEDKANQTNSNYTSPTTNIKKTATEIQADVKKINAGDATTIAEYKKYMTQDDYHLYTKYSDANSQGDEDNYAEFRIIEVGNHDGKEALTFQATHLLPSASRQIPSYSIVPVWGNTELCAKMNSGDIFVSFSSAFTNDIMYVNKASAKTQSNTAISTSCRFWLASFAELSGAYKDTEGSQYDYYKTIGIQFDAMNPALALTTRQGNACSGSSYNDARWWTRSSVLPGNESNTTFMAVRPDCNLDASRHYFANNSAGIVPCFAFGQERTVSFDNCGRGNSIAAQNVEIGKTATQPDAGTVDGFTLEGWYTNPKFTAASKWDFSTSTVSTHVTLYANWVVNTQESAYWLAPAMGSSSYVSETQNVLKTAAEIQADVAKLKAGDSTVTAEYTKYMNENSYHLYTKWNGSGNSGKNAYVEFQIISVGKHYNIEGDDTSADGSCISFMSSYLLPVSYQMRANGTNNGGWPSADTTLRISMNEGGEIYNNFDDAFTADIAKTTKRSQTTLSSVSPTEWGNSEDKFWIVSYKEFTGHDADNCTGEGLGYSNMPSSTMKTRAGGGNEWWLRTIKPDTFSWCFTTAGGAAGYYHSSSNSKGVAPCFSF